MPTALAAGALGECRCPGFGVFQRGGRSARQAAGGVTTAFHHAGSAVIVEKQGSTTTAAYTYGNSLVRKDGEVPLYDGLGSARAQSNSQQSVTATLTPDGFGQTVATTGSTTSPYGYAGDWGYRTEGDAGLMHVGARYYDAQVARFVSRDTYLDQHPYLYCEHDGVNWVDPSGHKWDPLVEAGAVTMAVGAVIGMVGVVVPLPHAKPLVPLGIVVAGMGGVEFIIGTYMPPITGREFFPSPSDDARRDHRREIEDGRRRGDIPFPPGGRVGRQCPRPAAAPKRSAYGRGSGIPFERRPARITAPVLSTAWWHAGRACPIGAKETC